MTFTVDVDLLSLNSLFPFLDQYNQYFSLAADEEGCRGEGSNSGALLTFDIEVTNCGMLISVSFRGHQPSVHNFSLIL